MSISVEVLYEIFLKSNGVTTDSRNVEKGQIFFALRGLHFNGNNFAAEALQKGASYAIVDDPACKHDDNRYFLVNNTLETLQHLAAYHRKHLHATVIAITGSNGKTTTKELVYRVLSEKYKTSATAGNLNNHIGVPLTILKTSIDTEFLVLELGASLPGEIKLLCDIAQPDYGIITNAGKDHLEGFGSVEKVFETLVSLYKYIHKNGKGIIVNADDIKLYEAALASIVMDYGMHTGKVKGFIESSFPFLECSITHKNVELKLKTNLYGSYNIYNVLAAAAVGIFFDIPKEYIAHAIQSYIPQNNRSQFVETAQGNKIVLDAYNANPSSMIASLSDFCKYAPLPKNILLGSMLELGKYSDEEHLNILKFLSEQQSTELVCLVGLEFMQFHTLFPEFHFFIDIQQLLQFLKEKNIRNRYVFVKGSRGITMEKVLTVL